MKGIKKTEARVSFEPGKIKAEYNILYNINEETGYRSCYIPAFDLTFSAPDGNELKKRADQMVKSFVDYYFKEDNYKNFFLTLHKLGFKSPNHNLTMKEVLNNKTAKAKFINVSADDKGFDCKVETEETEYAFA